MNDNKKDYFQINPQLMRLEYKYERLVNRGKLKEAKELGDRLSELWLDWAKNPA